MARFHQTSGSVRITPVGRILLAVCAVGLILAGVGPSRVQMPGFVVAALIGLVLLGGFSGGTLGRSTKGLADRRAEFGAGPSRHSEIGLTDAAEDELWRQERERRLQDDRPPN